MPSGATPQSITAYTIPGTSTGTIWYADSRNNAIGSISISINSGAYVYVVNPEIPLGKDKNGNSLVGLSISSQIVVGTDSHGTLWFTEYNSSTSQGAIGSYDPVTKVWAQELLGSGQVPYAITTGPGGNIWFSEAVPNTSLLGFGSSALGVINASAPGAPTEYAISPTTNGATLPYRIVKGPDGNIWYSGNNTSTIGTFNLTTASFATQDIPQETANAAIPDGITVGPDGNIWFTDNTGAIDVIDRLAIATQPSSSVTPGAGFGFTVTVETAGDKIDSAYNGNVTVAIANNPGVSTLGGTLTVAAVNGVATFSGLTLNNAGNGYTFQATASGLPTITTGSFNVTSPVVNSANQLLVHSLSPASLSPGSPFTVVIYAVTSGGIIDSTYSGNVTLALASNPGGSTSLLGGTLTVAAVNGVATFSGLTLNNAGNGYTLRATATGLTATTTGSFNVTSPVVNNATKLLFYTQPPGSLSPGSPFTVIVYAATSGNALATTFSGYVTLALVNNPGGSTLSGPTTVAVNGGYAVFPGLSLNNPGVNYTFQATANGLTPVMTTTPLTIQAPPPQIQSASVVFTQKTNPRTHRKIGKPVLTGYQFTFNTAMNPATTGYSANYQVQTYAYVRVKVGRKSEKKLELQPPIGITVNYLPSSDTVELLTGKQAFKYGGQITLIGTGVSSALGGLLGNNVVYNISAGGHNISLA